MTRQTVLSVPSLIVQAGSRVFGPANVPLGVFGAVLTVDTTQQPDPFPAFTWFLEGTLDGVTWLEAGSGSGPAQNRAGKPLGISSVGGDFFNAITNPNRKIRFTTTLDAQAHIALLLETIS